MLPRKNRLLEAKDFEVINREGAFFSGGEVFLKVKPNNLKETRVGFSVGIKFSPKAVERNRMKRQLREIFRKNIENIKKGFDIAVSVRKGASWENLESEIIFLLKKAKLI